MTALPNVSVPPPTGHPNSHQPGGALARKRRRTWASFIAVVWASALGNVALAQDAPLVFDIPSALTMGTIEVKVGASNRFGVKLERAPTDLVSIRATAEDGTDAGTDVGITVSSGLLYFNANTWDTTQYFTVHGIRVSTDKVKVAVTSTDTHYSGHEATKDVNVSLGRIVLSKSHIDVEEPDWPQGTVRPVAYPEYTVYLDSPPTGNVNIVIKAVENADPDGRLDFWAGHLAFLSDGGWDLSAVDNDDTTAHDADGCGPRQCVRLTFTKANYNVVQTVSLSVPADGDSWSETGTIQHMAHGGGYQGVTNNGLTVTMTDQPRIRLDLNSDGVWDEVGVDDQIIDLQCQDDFRIAWGPAWAQKACGPQQTFYYDLSEVPAGEVTVTASSSAPDAIAVKLFHQFPTPVCEDDEYFCTLVDTQTITSPDGWLARYRFAVIPYDDDNVADDLVDVTLTVNGTVANDPYDGVSKTLRVRVRDEDSPSLITSASAVSVLVNGTGSVGVKLSDQPAEDVTVTASSSDSDVVTTSSTLTFTSDNWNTEQSVALTGVAGGTATLSLEASGSSGYVGISASVAVTVTTGGLTFSPVTTGSDGVEHLAVNETDLTVTASYTVALQGTATGNVTVTVGVQDGSSADVTLVNSPTTLTFTPTTLATPQTVQIYVAPDGDAVDDAATLVHTTSGGGWDGFSANLPVRVSDDDPGILVSTTSVTITETATQATESYTVKLSQRPNGVGQVTVTSAVKEAGSEVSVTAGSSLTFNASTWDTPQTVTVAFSQDDDGDDESATIVHAASGLDYGDVDDVEVSVTVTDKDGVEISTNALTVAEGGTETYTVHLKSSPTGGVIATATVAVASSDTAIASVSDSSLTFSNFDFSTAQMITVTGVEDSTTGDRETTITHTPSGYRGVTSGPTLTVTVTDNDGAMGMSRHALSLSEGQAPAAKAGALPQTKSNVAGATASYRVRLRRQPLADVLMAVVPDVPNKVEVVENERITFTPEDWNDWRTVTARANPDPDGEDERANLVHRAVGGGFDLVQTMPVTIKDDDGITVSATRITASEADGVAAYNIRLDSQPAGDVVVTPASNDPRVAIVSPPKLTFTPNDWNDVQTVRVLGVDDLVAGGGARTATISHAVTGYGTVTAPDVSATITDSGRSGTATTHNGGAGAGSTDGQQDDDQVPVAGLADTAGLLPAASDTFNQGFVRVVNHDVEAGAVRIDAIDDWSQEYETLTLPLPSLGAAHFNSNDLELGNFDKGLSGGVGTGFGDWRLGLTSDLDIEWLSYVRSADGFLTAMHDKVVVGEAPVTLPTFNPGSNQDQVSRLRLVNPGSDTATVTITGTDDSGASPGTDLTAVLNGGRSLTFTAAELESGLASRLTGALGNGVGKWRLDLASDRPVLAMSLMSSPTGHLTNLSTVPTGNGHLVPLLPAASDDRQGFVRVRNRSDVGGVVQVWPRDESDRTYDPLLLTVRAGETVHFNSDDLEDGSPSKGLTGATGAGIGDWWLEMTSDLDVQVLSYIRTRSDGFLTAMHDLAPSSAGQDEAPSEVQVAGPFESRVVTLNPGGNRNQIGVLRLLNADQRPATVTVTAIDDVGMPGAKAVVVTVPGMRALNLTSQDLEAGNASAFSGAFGDGEGRWRLVVSSDRPVHAMSLISARLTGHLTNLSTTTR